MRVTVVQRALAAFVFLLAAGSMAAIEPVHGIAHHEATHHHDAHHHGAGQPAVLPLSDDNAHPHAIVDHGLTTRIDSWQPAIPARRVVADGFEHLQPPPPEPLFVIHRWSSTHAPPPPPRAPPV